MLFSHAALSKSVFLLMLVTAPASAGGMTFEHIAPGQTMKSELMDIADGRLYVPEAGNHSGDGQFVNLHWTAIDQETGAIYVADTGNRRIQVFQSLFRRRPSGPPAMVR